MNEEINTPRTDKYIQIIDGGMEHARSSDLIPHARQIERELFIVTQECEALRKKLDLIGCWNGTAKDACDILHKIKKSM